MAWVPPSAEDVLSEFTPSEVATINNLMQGGANTTNRIIAILGRTVAEIRGYVQSGAYQVDGGSQSTVPASMVVDAVAIARWRLLVAVPQLKQLQTDERKAAMLASVLKLQACARQEYTPDSPAGAPVAPSAMWNSENKIIMRTHPVPKPATQWTPQKDSYANPNAPPDATTSP